MDDKNLIVVVDQAFKHYKSFQLRRFFFRAFLIIIIVISFALVSDDNKGKTTEGIPSINLGEHIAIININDMMGEGSLSRRSLTLLDQQASGLKAIMLRVDSPGSGVTDAEAVYKQLLYYRSQGVPIVASFSSSATSGAYLVSSPADRIFSYRNSVVGSIGVIMEVPQVKPLLDKVGVGVVAVRSGSLKAAAQPFEPLNAETKKELQRLVNRSASWFLNLVQTNRGLSNKTMKELSKGGVYNGDEALELGLVDSIGEWFDALEWLHAEYPGLADVPVVNYDDYVYIPYQSSFNPLGELMWGIGSLSRMFSGLFRGGNL
ncbi:MAG TPA: signal peptide peptidase SppA [Gammaproteobacteria bacterium]|nr:signal peptide peptidase SppA [Gammaproteobacteria bacterium]